MIPEAELVRNSFTVRSMDFPENISFTKNSLLRWCCLSLGLISENETRDKAFLIFDALFSLLFSNKTNPTTLDIQEHIKKKSNVIIGEKLIRYHLNRLISLKLLVRKNNKYFLNPSSVSEDRKSLAESFECWVKKEIEKEMDLTKKAIKMLQEKYEK